MIEKRKLTTGLAILAVVGLGGFVAGCGSDSISELNQTQKDAKKAVNEAQKTIDEHGDDIEKGLDEAQKQLDEHGDEIQKGLDEAGESGDVSKDVQKALEDVQRQIEEAQK